jgi:Putative prokaryotic signal transducing protein
MPPPPNPAFADIYRPMSDRELNSLAADWHSLTEEARTALAAEFATRHLDLTEPPPPDDHEPEFRDLVTLRRYRDLSEAIIARGAIESAGIFCFLKDENTVRLDWQISNMIGGIRLQVAAADVEAAEAVLNQPIPNSIDFGGEFLDEPGFEQPRCPRCNSTNITYERSDRKTALTSLFILGLPLPLGSASWTCEKCGLHWQEEEDSADPSNSPA